MPHTPKLMTIAMLLTLALPACSGAGEADEIGESEDSLRSLSAAEILGDLAYGETSDPVTYERQPTYRAYRFQAAAGDEVDVWVRSADGNVRAWLLKSDFRNLDANDDADATTTDAHIVKKLEAAGTYYVAFREKNGNRSTVTVSLAKKVAGPAVNRCVARFARERARGCYYAGQPGCQLDTYVYCEDGTRSGRQPMFTHWYGMANFCAGHCVEDAERVHFVADGSVPVNTSSHQHGSCPYPVTFNGNAVSVKLELVGLADSPFVIGGHNSSSGAQSLGANGEFTLGNVTGRVHGQTVNGKFVLEQPAKVTITGYSFYTNGGSGGTCGASIRLAQPTTLPLTPL